MFKFKGISSEDMQVIIEEEEHFIARASQRYETIEIEGRDGAIFDELGYSVVERPIYVQCLNINKIDDILAWLNGEGEFEYKGRKTTARFYSQLEPQRSSCIRIIDTTFIRDPFWYKANEEYILAKDRKDKTAKGENIDLTDSAEMRFSKFKISGNSKQNGTPTPETPVDVKSCGDNVNLFDKNKSKFRFCIESAVALIPSGLYLLYLLGSDTLWDFVDYAVVGVKYFTHKITYIDFMFSSIVYFAMGIGFVVICSLTMKNILSIDDKNRKIEIIRFVIISFAAGVVAYPLTDRSHILLAVMPYMICWFLSMKDIHITKKEGISIYLFSAMLIVLAMPVIVNIDDSHKWSSLNRFEHILVDEDMEQNIVRVCDFIKENNQKGIDVYITNESACVYMIPLEIYNKNYDMLLLGNLGSNTVEDLLDVDDSSLFLVYKNKEIINWQCHFELIDYITENYECVGEINNYDIYRKNAE